MGAWDSFKKMLGIEEVDEDDLDEEEEETKPAERSIVPPDRTADYMSQSPSRPPVGAPSSPTPPAARKETARYTNKFNMVVIEPTGFEESPKLVDSLKAKKPVIINLENLETDSARKIFDFLSGATYALNGNVQKVANNIFVFAPENVNVSYNDGQKPASTLAAETNKNPWR